MAQIDCLKGRFRVSKEGVSLTSATIRENRLQFYAAEAAGSIAEVALRSVESQLIVVCASESSLWEDVGQ